MSRKVIGISAFYHDSAACLLDGGDIIAAAQEERFTRKKHDPQFPARAIEYCLSEGQCSIADCESIVFYDKPLLKFERVLETYLAEAPFGYWTFVKMMPTWLKEKLFLESTLKKELSKLTGIKKNALPKIFFAQHHHSHACSAFMASPFDEAAVLCCDGVGEWATTTAWLGKANKAEPLWSLDFPHSLGLLYSAFTAYCGFKVNSGEYKLMGLAPYGEPTYANRIRQELIDIKDDGSYRLNLKYFNFTRGLTMTNRHFHKLFDGPPKPLGSTPTTREMDLARSIQVVLEEVLFKMATHLKKQTQAEYLCLSGGVALNCVANGKLRKSGLFKDIWVSPPAGDAGGALGAAYAYWYQFMDNPRSITQDDQMKGAYLGPQFNSATIVEAAKKVGAQFTELPDEELFKTVAHLLNTGNVVGWYQGRMEYGPRALGSRSILADSRDPEMQSKLNLKIKFRESFRPFAPIVIDEDRSQYFEQGASSPYMLFTDQVHKQQWLANQEEVLAKTGFERLKVQSTKIPAVTHVDGSARVQTVKANTNPRLHQLMTEFKKQTGCSVLINTSFNVRGEPIVCTPEEALACFANTKMDALVMGNTLLKKEEQPQGFQAAIPGRSFELD